MQRKTFKVTLDNGKVETRTSASRDYVCATVSRSVADGREHVNTWHYVHPGAPKPYRGPYMHESTYRLEAVELVEVHDKENLPVFGIGIVDGEKVHYCNYYKCCYVATSVGKQWVLRVGYLRNHFDDRGNLLREELQAAEEIGRYKTLKDAKRACKSHFSIIDDEPTTNRVVSSIYCKIL